MKVLVGCARDVQVAYVTLHHRGCTLVPPSTWAKRVPRVPVRHSGNASGNHWAPLHDRVHPPTYLPTYLPTLKKLPGNPSLPLCFLSYA